jgi:uncharacterized protein (TIGR02118 family)
MSDAKLMVMYPLPKNVDAFEKIYQNEHVPLAVAKLGGKTKIVATKILGSPQGIAPFYRIAEVYFPSKQALEACAASDGAKRRSRTPSRSLRVGRRFSRRPVQKASTETIMLDKQ